jgi:hypothetical protein
MIPGQAQPGRWCVVTWKSRTEGGHDRHMKGIITEVHANGLYAKVKVGGSERWYDVRELSLDAD